MSERDGVQFDYDIKKKKGLLVSAFSFSFSLGWNVDGVEMI